MTRIPNPNTKRMSVMLAALAAAGVVLSGCSAPTPTETADPTANPTASESETTEPAVDVSAVQALAGDVTSLDPAKAQNAPDLMMSRMRFDTLIRRDDSGTVVSGLAQSWEQTPTSATFTLRDDLTCSDGSPLSADDIAASLTRLADPATGGAAAQVFGAGGSPVITAEGNTVTVTLTQANSDLMYGLSLPHAGIICAPGLADEAALLAGGAGVGSGPYYLTDQTAGASYTLAASTDYTQHPGYAALADLGGQIPTTMTMRVYADEATMANDMLTGALDYAGFTGPDAGRMTDASAFTMVPTKLIRTYAVINQHEGHPGADPAVRKAIAQALDAEAFNQVVTRGTGSIMYSFADESVMCANTDASLVTPTDVEAAKAALSGLSIIVQGSNAVAGGVGNEYLQTALTEAGANVTLKNSDNATWATEVLGNAGEWDITVQPNLNLVNLLTQPAAMLVGPDPQNGGRNYAGIQNDGFAAGFGAALATTDDTEKCAAWQGAQESLLATDDIVPLVALTSYYVNAVRTKALSPDGIYDPSTLRVVG